MLRVLSALVLVLAGCQSTQREPAAAPPPPPTASSSGSAGSTEGARAPAAPVEAPSAARPAPDPNDRPTTADAIGTATPPDVAAPPADAARTPSGLATKVLAPGTGTAHPTAEDRVTVHYSGWTTDGHRFDSSVARGEPATFPLNAVIAGWTEGLQLMVVGEKRRLWIPEELAYRGRPGRPAGMLVFDVGLISIQPAPAAPTVPPDVAAPPRSARRTASGLAYRQLRRGTGERHPTAASRVEVHYSGWTTDGQMFDSSVTRGEPATFPLNRVIAGWTEGVQLMVEGERMRFWIPESLAYQGRPGAPAGMLVFDVELLRILD